MYTILVCDDNTLYGSKKERIVQRSKLVDNLVFIVNPIYKNTHDMTNATVLLEYLRPVSKKYETEILTLSEEKYNDCYLQYKLPFDTNLTSEAGSVSLQLTFAYVELDENGKDIQRVRKTTPTTIEVVPVAAWADVIPDNALSSLDQRLIMMNAQIKALDEMNQIVADSKADNIKYDENENSLQLLSGNKEIGDKVTIKTSEESLKDGVPVVDFGNISDGDIPSEDEEDDDNVVEF